LSFLKGNRIPVFDVGIGDIVRKDIIRASVMKDRKKPEYAVILAFDVKINADAKKQAALDGVQVFTADIIYHLFDKFSAHMKQIEDAKKSEMKADAIFPVHLEVARDHVFHRNNPIVVGCKIVGGQLRTGTPLCVYEKNNLVIGRVSSIEKDKKPIEIGTVGEMVCVKVEQKGPEASIHVGRHFDAPCKLLSKVTRESIDTLENHFRGEMRDEDWEMITGLKKLFGIP